MSTIDGLLSVRAVLRAQHLDRDTLDQLTLAGLRDALGHARARVPAYGGDRYDIGTPRDFADFTRLPMLRKTDVLALGEDRFRDPAFARDAVTVHTTSGTSGQILEAWHDPANYAHDRACNIRRFAATGGRYRPWSRLVHFKPFPLDTAWYQKLGVFRRSVVLSALPVRARVEHLVRERPHAVIGYPVMLRDLLRGMRPDELATLRRTLRAVFTESELLTPEVRHQLTSGFGVPVFNEYSAYELMHIAYDCAEGELHIAEDRVHVEIVDPDGHPVPDGTEGHVVVTGWRERAMPLLRYWLGDRATRHAARCACGRTFARLHLTKGRADDYVVLPDGERIYAGTFIGMAISTPGVAECMVRQDSAGNITVFLIPDGRADRGFDDLARDARAWLHATAGRPFDLTVRRADALELTAGGKGRFVVSEFQR
ncbi:phenylacetate--CoA ligase family protein [Dactylosporangium sp. NPDC000521]|uniref:phenylacetate--CoA ligase family protein n=1 Tax=Dactylosporangium sp. NPDC000521 TaxID=3363975 RepID=UPI0036A41904